jgi:hypothetical protein
MQKEQKLSQPCMKETKAVTLELEEEKGSEA